MGSSTSNSAVRSSVIWWRGNRVTCQRYFYAYDSYDYAIHTCTFQHIIFISYIYGWLVESVSAHFDWCIRSLWAFEWDLVVTIEGVGLIRSLPEPVPDSLCFTCSPSPPTVESTSSSEPTNSPRLTSSRLYRRGAQCWPTHTGNSRASLPTGR